MCVFMSKLFLLIRTLESNDREILQKRECRNKYKGFINSPVYSVLHAAQGEFKIKVFRKELSCNDNMEK